MYDFKAGQLAPEEVLPIIRRSVSLRGWSLVPVWTRHHWATSVVTPHGNSLRVVVYDSAAAPPTRRDFITLWRRLGISAKVIQHRRQPRDSFECGLHICLLAIVLATSERAPRDFQNSLEVLSLDTWRRALLLSGPDAMNIDTVLECAPAAASLLPQSVSGGAITQRYKVDRTRPQTVYTHSDASHSTIDVDDDSDNDCALQVAEVSFSLPDVMQFAASPSEEHDISAWFAGTAAAVSDERETWSRPPQSEPPETRVLLRTLPSILCHLRPQLTALARFIHRDDRSRNAHVGWNCWQDAVLITDTVMDAVARCTSTLSSNCVAIECSRFTYFAKRGGTSRLLPRPVTAADSICVIAHFSSHFVLLAHKPESRDIVAFDSLPRTKSKTLSDPMQAAADRFACLLLSLGREVHYLRYRMCPAQTLNNCGVEAARNMLEFAGLATPTSRTAVFNRDMIKAVYQAANSGTDTQAHLQHVISAVIRPPPIVPAQPTTAVKPPAQAEPHPKTGANPCPALEVLRYRNDPYTGKVTLTPKPTATPCCGREKLTDQWCAWHHPRLQVPSMTRLQCTGVSGKKRERCRENALASIDGHSWKYCWYHLPPTDKRALLNHLHERTVPTDTVHNEASAVTTHRPERAISHANVTSFVQSVPDGSTLRVALQRDSGVKQQLLGMVTRKNQHHIISVTAHFCGDCGEWHELDSNVEDIPEENTRYFSLTVRSSMPELTLDCGNAEDG
eukprot:PhM_4_TR16755/c1_g1_i5/m.26682